MHLNEIAHWVYSRLMVKGTFTNFCFEIISRGIPSTHLLSLCEILLNYFIFGKVSQLFSLNSWHGDPSGASWHLSEASYYAILFSLRESSLPIGLIDLLIIRSAAVNVLTLYFENLRPTSPSDFPWRLIVPQISEQYYWCNRIPDWRPQGGVPPRMR